MKKRIMGLVGVSFIGAMLVTSLTGCGLQTKATDIVVNDGDTVIIDQEDMSTETPETEETNPVDTTEPSEPTETSTPDDEITSSEVIGNETEEPVTEDLEDENIILYAEKMESCEPLDEFSYSPYDGIIHAESVIPLYDGKGYRVGEMKIGGTVYVGEVDMMNNWARFKNPIEEAEYDYLYTIGSKVQSNNMTRITTQEAENAIKEVLGNEDVYTYTEVTDDMEMFEFLIPISYDETGSPKDSIYFQFKDFCDDIWYHTTFSIVCTEDTDGINCKVYYRD